MNNRQIAIGLCALVFGAMVYFMDRPSGSVWFLNLLPLKSNPSGIHEHVFGELGRYLPAFAHVFALSLITGGVINRGRIADGLACGGWILVDGLFEFGQKYSRAAASLVPDWFSRIPLLDQTANYFQMGNFHAMDIAWTIIGGFTAFVVLALTNQRKEMTQPILSITLKRRNPL